MSSGQLEPLAPDSLADRWVEAWVSGRFATVCTVDVHYEDPATRNPLSGLGPLESHARTLLDAFPDVRVERTGPRVGDEHFACVPWRAAGTHRGQLGALPGSNRFVTLHGVHFIELKDGRVQPRARVLRPLRGRHPARPAAEPREPERVGAAAPARLRAAPLGAIRP